MSKITKKDAQYIAIMLAPLKECAKYKPAFGKQGNGGVTLQEFHTFYAADPLYAWVGLDSPLMYAAHKAAGGMTSIYRQLGIGCERLLREVAKDTLALNDEQVAWSYEYEKEKGVMAPHTLDLRIDLSNVENVAARHRLREWLTRVGIELKLTPKSIKALTGTVLEVRQGYKSADSKRQNADLRFGLNAHLASYLPVICVVSTQVSETVIRRYRNAKLLVMLGQLKNDSYSTFAFFKSVIGYDLAGFFARSSPVLKAEFAKTLTALLTPE